MVLSLNDDRLIMEFLSGRYSGAPQGYGIHLKYPLSWMIAMLYKTAPDYDWYGYTMLLLMLLCVILIGFRVARLTKDRKERPLWIASVPMLALFAIGAQMISITYSTVAAIMGATILFLYGTSDGRTSDVLILGILSALTWCLRYHLFYMILPAAALIWFFRDGMNKKPLFRKFFVPLTVLLFVGGSMLVNHAMYGSDEWQEFEAFNNSRITMYDNPNDYYFPPYEEKPEYYKDAGLKNVERRLLIYYGLLLGRDEIPTDTFHKMVEIRKNYGDNETEYFSARFVNGTKSFAKRVLKGECGALFYAANAGFIFLLILLFRKKNRQELAKVGVFYGCLLAIFWGMEMNGRMPERVIYSLSIMLFLCMVTAFFWEKDSLPSTEKWKKAGAVLVTVFAVYGIANMYGTWKNNAEDIALNEEKASVVQYCNDHPENFYYISTGYLCTSGYNFSFGKVDNSRMNYMSTGDWVSYSPLQRERLEEEGWDSAVESLLTGDNVYMISGDDRYLAYFRDYLEYRCQKLVVPVVEEKIAGGLRVYHFEMRDEPMLIAHD